MPIQTQILNNNNFVRSPELAPDLAFSEYLALADRVLADQRDARQQWEASPFSPAVLKRKEQAERVLRQFVACFQGRFTVRPVQEDPAFLSAGAFLSRYSPVRLPFSVLHCDLEMPLHTVHAFRTPGDLARVNAAVAEDTPLAWWQRGPGGRPCYLFGRSVWELKPCEVVHSEAGIAISFVEMSQRRRSPIDRLTEDAAGRATATASDLLSESARVEAWRRAHGKCSHCGGREQLEFDFIVPQQRGVSVAAENIELLCGACYRRKHDKAAVV
jgi:hypothetical protein